MFLGVYVVNDLPIGCPALPPRTVPKASDLVRHVVHGGPHRRRKLRARNAELEQLHDDDGLHLAPQRANRRRITRRRRVLGDGVQVALQAAVPRPLVQAVPLLGDHVPRPLPGDHLQEHHPEAVHVALRRRAASQAVLCIRS